MNAADREQRDARALELFVGGATYRQIAATIGVKSTRTAHTIVQRALVDSAQRRALLTDEALAIHQERQERLLLAHWKRALDGDHRSAEICRRILAQQSRLYGLDDMNAPLPAPTLQLDGDDEQQQGEEPTNELAKLRALRGAG